LRTPVTGIEPEELRRVLEAACKVAARDIKAGKVADYIPALARVPSSKLGAAIVTVDGDVILYGDAQEPFSIQSISKVFTLTMVLSAIGDSKRFWERVGREPSGSAFNSIVQLEMEHGIPRNPLINAGAIVVSDVLHGVLKSKDTVSAVVDFMRQISQSPRVSVDPVVAESEAVAGFRNASLANFLKSFRNLDHDVADVLHVYFNQCAIAMSCEELARASLYLAVEGDHPLTGSKVLSSSRTRRVNSIMLMCGHYDASGDFAFRVGLPGKSGVGGGIVAVAPGRAVIVVWSPGLNKHGNSHAGTIVLEHFARQTGWSVF